MELNRIKKSIWVLFLFIFVEMFIFGIRYKEKDNGYDAVEYSNYFERNVQNVFEQAHSFLNMSLFSSEDEFSKNNIERTIKDYKKISDVQIYDVHANQWEYYFSTPIINYTLVLIGLFLVVFYASKESYALKQVIHSTRNGQGVRCLRICLSIIAWIIISAILMYLMNLMLLCIKSGVNLWSELSASAQSIPRYMNFTEKVNIFQFICIRALFSSLVISVICAFCWMLYFIFQKEIIVFLIMLVIGIVEHFCETKCFVTSKYRLFGVININSFIKSDDIFSYYENLKIGNRAINSLYLFVTLFPIMLILFLVIAYVCGNRMYPVEIKKREKLLHRMRTRILTFKGKKVFEEYKLLYGHKAWMVFAVFILYIILMNNYEPYVRPASQRMYFEFVERNTGEPSETAIQEIEARRQKVEEINEKCVDIYNAYLNGEVGELEYYKALFEMNAYEDEWIFVNQVSEQLAYIEMQKENGNDVWIVNTYAFGHLFRKSTRLNYIIVLLSAAMLTIMVSVQEKSANTLHLLNTLQEGRTILFRRKRKMVMGLSVLMYLFTVVNNYWMHIKIYGIAGINAPIQSYSAFSDYKIKISFLQYLLGKHCIEIIIILLWVLLVSVCGKGIKMGKVIHGAKN